MNVESLSVEQYGVRVDQAKDHLLRQLEHLRREIDYGYPIPRLREQRNAFEMAMRSYMSALADLSGAQRREARTR